MNVLIAVLLKGEGLMNQESTFGFWVKTVQV